MTEPAIGGKTDGAPAWWRGLLAVLFYLGVRSGTALRLRWDMLVRRDDGVWADVPAEAVAKTEKAFFRLLHPRAVEAVDALRPHGQELVLPWPHSYTHLSDLHERLQVAAKVPPIKGKLLSPQAWRRTFGTEMGRVGAKVAMQVARLALDHGDERTTANHYVDLEAEFIRALPNIF